MYIPVYPEKRMYNCTWIVCAKRNVCIPSGCMYLCTRRNVKMLVTAPLIFIVQLLSSGSQGVGRSCWVQFYSGFRRAWGRVLSSWECFTSWILYRVAFNYFFIWKEICLSSFLRYGVLIQLYNSGVQLALFVRLGGFQILKRCFKGLKSKNRIFQMLQVWLNIYRFLIISNDQHDSIR